MNIRIFTFLTVAIGFCCAPACTADDDGSGGEGTGGEGAAGGGGEAPLEPKVVPSSPELIEGSGFCVPLNEGEALWSVSPEGHAWIASSHDSVQQLRVFDPFDESAVLEDTLYVGALEQVRAWSQTDAAVIASDGLWSLQDLNRVQLTPPTELASVSSLCGDPSVNGMLLSAGALFELRGETWWQWDEAAGGPDAPRRIAAFDGECIGTDNVSWMMADDGSLWQLSAADYGKPMQFEAGASLTVTSDLLAVLESAQLWVGPASWQPWVFDGNVPTAISASGGRLWLAADEQLLRYDGEDFVEVSHELDGKITQLAAHASGVWLAAEGSVCHVSTAPMLRVDGLRPYQRSTQSEYDFSVLSSDESLTLSASIAGEAIALTVDDDTGALVGQVELAEIGWNELRLEADGVERVIPIKRTPAVERSWAADIEPIYLEHCASANCHGDPDSTMAALNTYEDWVSNAQKIKNRVVLAGTMPPASAQEMSDWDDADVATINEWLEGELLP